jgi:hypothetical protein
VIFTPLTITGTGISNMSAMNDQQPCSIRRVPLWTWLVSAAVLIPTILGFANKLLDLILVAAGDEEGIFALTPIINYLLATAGFFCLLVWAIGQGTFHDLNQPSRAMFENEQDLDGRPPESVA